MKKNTAKLILVFFNLIAVPLVIFAIFEVININSAINNQNEIIPFDSGAYYLFLASIFWVMTLMQLFGKKGSTGEKLVEKYAGIVFVAWFVLMLLTANVIPYILQEKIEALNYYKCDDPSEISRVAKGVSIIYSKSKCREIGDRE